MYLIREKREKTPKPLKEYYIDIGAVAVKPRKKKRYMKLPNGKYLKINYIFVQKQIGYKQYHGYYTFVAGTVRQYHVRRFLRQIDDISADNINHDKAFIFKNIGTEYFGYKPKAFAEHIQGFKRVIYLQYRKGLIKTAVDLLNAYRYYFNRLGLREINIY